VEVRSPAFDQCPHGLVVVHQQIGVIHQDKDPTAEVGHCVERPPIGVVSEDDLRAFALRGLTRRLQIIGVPLETVFA